MAFSVMANNKPHARAIITTRIALMLISPRYPTSSILPSFVIRS